MTMDAYTAAVSACDEALRRLQARYTRCSWLRFAAVLSALVFFFVGLQGFGYVGYPLAAAGTAAFILLVRRHEAIEREQRYQRALRAAAQSYLDRTGDGWRAFPHTGREYLSEEFPQGRDLDLFGKDSLYQFLCAAHTAGGRRRLAAWLRDGCPTAAIPERQEAVAELARRTDFALRLQALSPEEKPDGGALSDFLGALERTDRPSRAFAVLMWGLPCLALFFLLSAIVGVHPPVNLGAAIALILLQLGLALAAFKSHNRTLEPIVRFHQCVAPYTALLRLIETQPFESPYLRRLQATLKQRGGATACLKSLQKIGEAVHMRHNVVAFLLCNGLFLWDFHCMERFVGWRETHRADLPAYFEIVAELEALVSLSVLCRVRTAICFPTVTASAPALSFENMRHPLIDEARAVGNDFTLAHRTCVVTGSNMSGKTTFLRAIGVNLTLAYAGGPVCAASFHAARMRLLTSMRVEDSVSHGISSFYAELLRIKSIVDASRQGEPLIALIDEIYKGTNSRDRILGAEGTVRRLASPTTMTLVTTHDFELCELEKDPAADAINVHFTERYTGGEIVFDYRLHPGRCTTTNAQHLLRMVGILS